MLAVNRIQFTVLFLFALAFAGCSSAPEFARNGTPRNADNSIAHAFATRTSDVQVEGEGVVTHILSDDSSGSRHQRFVVRLPSGQTLLIAHNIDIAPRVDRLREGDSIAFNGEYVWNSEGGMVHWTHHDPEGKHVAGWLKHNGRTYQ